MARPKITKGRRLPALHGQRSTSSGDVALGIRIRVRRLEADMSQQDLAILLGVSFQQVQKYEKGVNRVSAIRLVEIAKILKESAEYFTGEHATSQTTQYTKLLTDTATQRCLKAFTAIADQQLRYKIVGLLESISGKAA